MDEDGALLPITPEALDAVALHTEAGPAFLLAYDQWTRQDGTWAARVDGDAPPPPKKPARKPRTPRTAAA